MSAPVVIRALRPHIQSIAGSAPRRRRRLRDIVGLPLTARRSIVIEINYLLRRNRLSLMAGDRAMTPIEKRAHAQFAREISEQNERTRKRSTQTLAPRLPASFRHPSLERT